MTAALSPPKPLPESELAAYSRETREELAAIVASPQFCNSRRYPAFLDYIVKAALAGSTDDLKERTLGIEVFGRRPDYDTNTDTIVRYTAGEVRKRLSLYYAQHHEDSGIRIHLSAGSYVPEFFATGLIEPSSSSGELARSGDQVLPEPTLPPLPPLQTQRVASAAAGPAHSGHTSRPTRLRFWYVLAVCCTLLALALLAVGLRARASKPPSFADTFWRGILQAPGDKLICTGSVIFAPNKSSGVITAPRDADYSFLSIQNAAALARVSGHLERNGATYTVQASAVTHLNDLRERPVILLGGYNNDWSLKLLAPLRFHFDLDPQSPAIVDSEKPGRRWQRNQTEDYGSTDDYAILARFHDSTTNGPVVVLAGLGRNGTEAATQFVNSNALMKTYFDQKNLSGANLEVVLRTRVIQGRTGAPSVEATYIW